MMGALRSWGRRVFGIVRLRQLLDRLRHRLSFVPILYVIVSIVFVQLTLLGDRALGDRQLPLVLTTTVDSARAVFASIAGALITSITLLLSMMLVTIQLASSQFSPRVVRDWLGNKTLQHTIGLVLGAAVFSLLGLRSTRSFGEKGDEVIPHTTVLMAVLLGVVCLVAVVRSVDHITQSVRIGSVARRIAHDTIEVVRHRDRLPAGQDTDVIPAARPAGPAADVVRDVPSDAAVIEAPTSGWIQQIDDSAMFRALPDGATGHVVVSLGGFVTQGAPLMWVHPRPDDDDTCRTDLLDAFALGDTRTMQQDVAFGIVQLTDIAVRALSPGINDPGTASDIIVHLGDVMVKIWETDPAVAVVEREGRTIVRLEPDHEQHLTRGFSPIRRYGASDPDVLATLLTTLQMLRSEVQRRDLPGPIEPITAMMREIGRTAVRTGWSEAESDRIDALCR